MILPKLNVIKVSLTNLLTNAAVYVVYLHLTSGKLNHNGTQEMEYTTFKLTRRNGFVASTKRLVI